MGIFAYSTLLIKPLVVGRGQGPDLLSDVLTLSNLHLVRLRVWDVCPTTWNTVEDVSRNTDSEFTEGDRDLSIGPHRLSWICTFKHKDNNTHPGPILRALFGPTERKLWTRNHLRFKYSSYSTIGPVASVADNVAYIAPTGKEELVSLLLLDKFDESEMFL